MSCNFKIPILFDMKSQCCGCAACATVCKRNAIDMENVDRCVGCNSCIKVCPLKD